MTDKAKKVSITASISSPRLLQVAFCLQSSAAWQEEEKKTISSNGDQYD